MRIEKAVFFLPGPAATELLSPLAAHIADSQLEVEVVQCPQTSQQSAYPDFVWKAMQGASIVVVGVCGPQSEIEVGRGVLIEAPKSAKAIVSFMCPAGYAACKAMLPEEKRRMHSAMLIGESYRDFSNTAQVFQHTLLLDTACLRSDASLAELGARIRSKWLGIWPPELVRESEKYRRNITC